MSNNLISFVDVNERVDDASALGLYKSVGKFMCSMLDPTSDTIVISRPDISSRSAASHMLVLSINKFRLVALKRCYDSPKFLRRELAIAEARRVIGFTDYSVELMHGLNLKSEETQDSCTMTRGWEDKDFIMIDFGIKGNREDLARLNFSVIHDIDKFITQLGRWAAFNYLLLVRDRHPGNFLYEKSTGLVYSIDNEEGPFDASGRAIAPNDIIHQIRQLIKKVSSFCENNSLALSFKSGFVEGWHLIADKLDDLTLINQEEKMLTISLLEQDPNSVVDSFTIQQF